MTPKEEGEGKKWRNRKKRHHIDGGKSLGPVRTLLMEAVTERDEESTVLTKSNRGEKGREARVGTRKEKQRGTKAENEGEQVKKGSEGEVTEVKKRLTKIVGGNA